MHGRIGDRELVDGLLADHRPSAVVNFAAETHVDRSIDGPGAFIQTNVVETHELLEAALVYWSALEGEERDAFRFLHVSTDEVYGTLGPDGLLHRGEPVQAELALRGLQGGLGPPRAGLPPHLRATHAHHELLQQLRALPFPGEARYRS